MHSQIAIITILTNRDVPCAFTATDELHLQVDKQNFESSSL